GILDAPRAARGRLLRALRRRGTRASGRGGARRRRWLVALGLRPRLQLGEAEHVLQALPVSILLPALRLPALRRRFRGTLGVHRRKNVLERILLLPAPSPPLRAAAALDADPRRAARAPTAARARRDRRDRDLGNRQRVGTRRPLRRALRQR